MEYHHFNKDSHIWVLEGFTPVRVAVIGGQWQFGVCHQVKVEYSDGTRRTWRAKDIYVTRDDARAAAKEMR